MATAITAALERSLQKCSIRANSSSSNDEQLNQNQNQNPNHVRSHPTLDLNSHISLPYHWEQCLDLKTGEIYYINWRNGMKAKEDPRSTTQDHLDQYSSTEDYYSSSSDDDDDSSSYDGSEESSNINNKDNKDHEEDEDEEEEEEEEDEKGKKLKDDVLVVAGCKSCLMYFMVPKHVEDCPKCSTTGQLLHFDRSENDIP